MKDTYMQGKKEKDHCKEPKKTNMFPILIHPPEEGMIEIFSLMVDHLSNL